MKEKDASVVIMGLPSGEKIVAFPSYLPKNYVASWSVNQKRTMVMTEIITHRFPVERLHYGRQMEIQSYKEETCNIGFTIGPGSGQIGTQ